MKIDDETICVNKWTQTLSDPKNISDAQKQLNVFDKNAVFHICHPFGDIKNPKTFFNKTYKPLFNAIPDLERRNMIHVEGITPEKQKWVGNMGNYIGTFKNAFLDIPPTNQLVHMRYHEFFQVKKNKIIEMHAIWDIPEIMMQANVWPMAPQLGKLICTPAPMMPTDEKYNKEKNLELVTNMLEDMCKHPNNPDPKIMKLNRYWHRNFNWYGPCGIGTTRGIEGFRNYHQIPFLNAMPNRQVDGKAKLQSHWFAQDQFVAETGWPNMKMKISKDGWMGIAPTNSTIKMRSLDFWRIENNKIRENWVLIDLLDIYKQINIDVLKRMKEII